MDGKEVSLCKISYTLDVKFEVATFFMTIFIPTIRT